eukprot:949040-Rhodomonas_salina.1
MVIASGAAGRPRVAAAAHSSSLDATSKVGSHDATVAETHYKPPTVSTATVNSVLPGQTTVRIGRAAAVTARTGARQLLRRHSECYSP